MYVRKRIHTAQVHRYTPHPHTPNTHNAHIRSCAQTYTKAHTHTRTHTASQYKGSDTLAQVRGYVFNRNGSAIDTRAGKNTHARCWLVRSRTGSNERVFRTNEPNRFVSLVRSVVSFTIRFTGNSTERTNEFPVALTPLSLTDSAENRAMACIT